MEELARDTYGVDCHLSLLIFFFKLQPELFNVGILPKMVPE